MLRTVFIFCIYSILISCNSDVIKTINSEEKNNTRNKERNYKRVSTYDEFINSLKNNDTINYEDLEKILNLKLFLKEGLFRFIIVTPPNTVNVNILDSTHTRIGFWLMSKDSLFKGTFYDMDIILRQKEIVSLYLFNHKNSKKEIHYDKDKNILKLLYGKKSEEAGFYEPGDSTWYK